MDGLIVAPSMRGRWGAVLIALYRATRILSLQELVASSQQDEETVAKALAFLRGQGWADQLVDGPEWVCTPSARVILDSLEQRGSKVLPQ
jgi:hypothetical protein